MTQAEYTQTEQATFNKCEAAFDSNPCKKTATKLAQARVELEAAKQEWKYTAAGRAENMRRMRGIASQMHDIAYDMKYIKG